MPAPTRPLPATPPARGPLDLLVTLFATFGAAVVLTTAAAEPASAHDRLVSADPADGATLDAPPSELALTFSAEMLATGAQVAVTTPDGTEAAQVAVDGEVLTATLPPDLSGGDWTVAWRVVSSDGHPIEGELSYAVAAGEGSSPTPSVSPSEPAESSSASSTALPESGPTSSAPAHQHGTPGAEMDEQGEANWTMSWLFGVAVLAAVGVAAAVVLRRRREQHAEQTAGTDDDDQGSPDVR